MKIITRKEAKALGLTRYFTGKPCPAGHIAERRISQKCCTVCNNISNKLRSRPEKRRRDSRKHNRVRRLKGKIALRALRELGIEIEI